MSSPMRVLSSSRRPMPSVTRTVTPRQVPSNSTRKQGRLVIVGVHSGYPGGGEADPRTDSGAWRSEFEQAREGRRAEYQARWSQAMEAAQQGGQSWRASAQEASQWGGETHPGRGSWQAHQQHLLHQQQHYQQPSPQPQQQPSNGAQLSHTGAQEQSLQQHQHHQGAEAKSNVQFNLKFCTAYGESLKIIGSGAALGSWNLSQAPSMQWSMGDVWTVTVQLPQSSVCEYKYVLLGGDGKPVKWQTGNNNVLAIKSDQDSLDVHDQWDGGAGSSIVSDGGAVTRESQLLTWANDIESKMSTTKHELRQWRVELSAAKEEAKVARIEVANLKTELGVAKENSRRQGLEIQALRSENSDLKTKLSESKVGFEKALETASLLMSEIDEVGPLPPVSGSGSSHHNANGHAQPLNGHPHVGGAHENASEHQNQQQQQQQSSWQEWQQAAAAAGNSHPSTSDRAGTGGQGGHGAWHNGQYHGQGDWNGGNSYTAGYNSYNAGVSSGFEPRWAGEAQGEAKYARANNHHNGHARP